MRWLSLSVVEDTVDHTVVILHTHLRVLQRVVWQKSGNLCKSEAIAVMTGYLSILLKGNNVTDTQGRVPVVSGMLIIEAVVKIFQHIAFQISGVSGAV